MRELIRKCEIPLESTEVMELSYYLLNQKSDSLFLCEATEGVVYGVSVTAGFPGEETSYTCETDMGFSYLRSEAVDFIHEIADANVTPTTFLAVVDEYVGSF